MVGSVSLRSRMFRSSMSFLITTFLIMARISGLIMSMPFLNSRTIPNLVKVKLVLLLTLVLAPVIPTVKMEMSIPLLLISIPSELCFGILMGGAITIIFASLSVAAGVISTQIGQAAAMNFNPTMAISTSPVGSIALFLATGVFLGTDSRVAKLLGAVRMDFDFPRKICH